MGKLILSPLKRGSFRSETRLSQHFKRIHLGGMKNDGLTARDGAAPETQAGTNFSTAA